MDEKEIRLDKVTQLQPCWVHLVEGCSIVDVLWCWSLIVRNACVRSRRSHRLHRRRAFRIFLDYFIDETVHLHTNNSSYQRTIKLTSCDHNRRISCPPISCRLCRRRTQRPTAAFPFDKPKRSSAAAIDGSGMISTKQPALVAYAASLPRCLIHQSWFLHVHH